MIFNVHQSNNYHNNHFITTTDKSNSYYKLNRSVLFAIIFNYKLLNIVKILSNKKWSYKIYLKYLK